MFSEKKLILDTKRHQLCKSKDNKITSLDGSLIIYDNIADAFMTIPDTLKTRQFFNLNTIDDNSISSVFDETNTSNTDEFILDRSNNNSESCNTNLLLPDSVPVKWTDANAVRALILKWKNHENDFKSTLIRNNKVWQMIADDLKKENPLWNFTDTQCENKFKDVRKSYIKVKNHNNQSGAKIKTCKFYKLEDALGEKPIVKPISISSTLKNRICPDSKRAISSWSFDSCDEKENVSQMPNRKKSRVAKELDEWSAQQRIEAKEREQARIQRHKEKMERQDKAIMIYKEQMEKLLEKL